MRAVDPKQPKLSNEFLSGAIEPFFQLIQHHYKMQKKIDASSSIRFFLNLPLGLQPEIHMFLYENLE